MILNPYAPLSGNTKRTIGLVSFFVLIAVWALVAGLGIISTNKLPAPGAVLHALGYLSWNDGSSMLASAAAASIQRIVIATAFVAAIGIPAGVLMGASPAINAAVSPLLDPFRSAPVVALLPIFVMALGVGEEMKIAFLFTGAVVYLIPMVRDAVIGVPFEYWESTRDEGATELECITRCVLPLAMPRIVDAMIASISIMWTYITVAEYVNAESGLGQLLQNARRFSAMDQVFATIIVIMVLALATYVGLTYAKRRIYPWAQ
jgi:ABC-type nitrate/sulfonate/bicarbonate transport system permease component